jgi:hypothetical protein
MDDIQKRRFFHVEPVRIMTAHAFQFVTSPRGVWRYFPNIGQIAGKNVFFFLNYLVDHCSAETRTGKNIGKKDLAQAHWFSNATIAAELCIDARAVSNVLQFAEEHGLIYVERNKTKLRFFAASQAFLSAAKHFTRCQDARDADEPKPEPKTLILAKYRQVDYCDRRHWLMRPLTLTHATVDIDLCDRQQSPSYIEGISKRNGKKGVPKTEVEAPKGVIKAPPPLKGGRRHLDIVRQMEWLFTRGRDGGYAVQVANDVVQKLVEERGYEFMQRLSDWYEENAGNSIQTHARAWRVSEKSIRNIVAHYEKMLAEHGQSAEQHRAPENLPTDQEREFWTSAAGNVPY